MHVSHECQPLNQQFSTSIFNDREQCAKVLKEALLVLRGNHDKKKTLQIEQNLFHIEQKIVKIDQKMQQI